MTTKERNRARARQVGLYGLPLSVGVARRIAVNCTQHVLTLADPVMPGHHKAKRKLQTKKRQKFIADFMQKSEGKDFYLDRTGKKPIIVCLHWRAIGEELCELHVHSFRGLIAR